jgi:hypothetical protein
MVPKQAREKAGTARLLSDKSYQIEAEPVNYADYLHVKHDGLGMPLP